MMLAALTLGALDVHDRRLVLYDTFAGMTAPDGRDIEAATGRTASSLLAASARDDHNHIWAVAPLDAVRANLGSTGYPPERIDYIAGDVCETLRDAPQRPIAVLRLDTDWYASTRCELERLFPLLAPGGVVIVDDYGWWEGSRRACDEYLADKSERLHRIPDDDTGCIAIKGAAELPADFMRRLTLP
jgi:hypothetical protein